MVKTVDTRPQRLSDKKDKEKEMSEILTAPLQNGFSEDNIKAALELSKPKPRDQEEKPISKTYLPYVKRIRNKIARILNRYKIETIRN